MVKQRQDDPLKLNKDRHFGGAFPLPVECISSHFGLVSQAGSGSLFPIDQGFISLTKWQGTNFIIELDENVVNILD